MVFQDYELIHTKRVNRERSGMNVFSTRRHHAQGGLNTIFFATIFGTVGYHLGNITPSEVLPSKNVLSKPGFLAYAKRAGKWVIVPAFIGYGTGVAIFGDMNELKKFGMFGPLYHREIANYKQELYYS